MSVFSKVKMLDAEHHVMRDSLLFILTCLVGILSWLGQTLYGDMKEQGEAIKSLERQVIRQTVVQEQQNANLKEIKDILRSRQQYD